MRIRPASFEDGALIRALMTRSMETLGPGFYGLDRAEAAARFLTVPDEGLIEDGTLFVVLSPQPPLQDEPLGEGEHRIVGVGGWSSRAKLFTGSEDQEGRTERLDPHVDAARVRAFFVHPDFARRGIARAIYERCETEAKAAGFEAFALMATLPGVPLYRALGFGEERPTTIRLPDGTGLDCVEMKKSLG